MLQVTVREKFTLSLLKAWLGWNKKSKQTDKKSKRNTWNGWWQQEDKRLNSYNRDGTTDNTTGNKVYMLKRWLGNWEQVQIRWCEGGDTLGSCAGREWQVLQWQRRLVTDKIHSQDTWCKMSQSGFSRDILGIRCDWRAAALTRS